MATISIQNLTFTYPGDASAVLDGVSIEVEEGDLVLVCGESGSGKTTLLRNLKTALVPEGAREGEVRIDGMPLDDLPALQQASRISFVMQDPYAQLVSGDAVSELSFGLRNIGLSEDVISLRIAEVASCFGLGSMLEVSTAELSGGQVQMLNLACAFAMHPEVIVLDEPTAQLDPIASSDFMDALLDLNAKLGITIIIAEQNMQRVLEHADKVVLLEAGHATTFIPQGFVEHLIEGEHVLFDALPVPARIFSEVLSRGESDEVFMARSIDIPLSAREGRLWFSRYLGEHSAQQIESAMRLVSKPSRSDTGPLAVLKDASFRYARDSDDVLSRASLKLERGRVHSLLGANGSGKTTLLKVLDGSMKPYRGRIDASFDAKAGSKRSSAMLPQDASLLFACDTVAEELFEMRPLFFEGRDFENEVDRLATEFGLDQVMDENPFELSYGQRQCVGICKLFLCSAQLYLLDEPSNGLDAQRYRALISNIERRNEEGSAFLISTHDMELSAEVSDAAFLLFEGHVVSYPDARALFCDSRFYTTEASLMTRESVAGLVTAGEVRELCRILKR